MTLTGLATDTRNAAADLRGKIARNRHTVKSVAALFSSNMTFSVLGAVGGLIVARFVGPEDLGLYRFFTIPLTYLMFLHLGTFDGLWRQIPYYVGKQEPQKVDNLASAAGAFNIGVSAIVSGGFVCCAVYSALHRDVHGVFGWLSQAACAWGVFYGGNLTSTYRTLDQFVSLARIQAVQAVTNFGMIVLLPFLKFYGLCVRGASPPILALWLCHRNRPSRVPYRFDIKALGEARPDRSPFQHLGESLYVCMDRN